MFIPPLAILAILAILATSSTAAKARADAATCRTLSPRLFHIWKTWRGALPPFQNSPPSLRGPLGALVPQVSTEITKDLVGLALSFADF